MATVIYGTMAIIIFVLGFFFIGPSLIQIESIDAIVLGWLTFPITLKLEWIIFNLWRSTPEGQVVIAKFKETI